MQRTLTGEYKLEDLRQREGSFFTRAGEFIANGRKLSGGITSNLTSSYQLINEINRDDEAYIHIIITARDGKGDRRYGGGDFWTATLSAISGNFSTAGQIVDHENGTYSVYFIAAWDEESDIKITLLHPSAAVNYLRDYVWPVFRIRWEGHFKHGNKSSQTICTIASTSEQWDCNKCVFSHPLALGNHVFVCEVPDGNLSCDSLIFYGNPQHAQSSRRLQKVVKQLQSGHAYFFTR